MNLRTLVQRQGPLPEGKIRVLLVELCNILSYLHEQAPVVVHRDFTPDNLILTDTETIKLIDFNIAQQSSGNLGGVAGKRAYMPPEQIRGQSQPQSDSSQYWKEFSYKAF